jgi:hypothetical protein
MPATSQITVSNVSPTAIMPVKKCTSVRIQENLGAVGYPSTDFLIFKGSIVATPVRIPAGDSYTFSRVSSNFGYYGVGAPVGWVQTVAGTTTFDQDEDGAD